MSHKLNQKQAIERLTMLLGDLLAGQLGDPLAVDAEDKGRLDELLTCLAEYDLRLTNRSPEGWTRSAPVSTQNDIDMTTGQIATDVARLGDVQRQNPALLRSSLDSLHDSTQRLDSLLEQHVGHFATAERLSRGTVSRESQ
jgi:hypothetical protein